ncbi:facilitated trehalose transporter Tret1-like [Melanaphis sacchari]|uniref:facilitated trehalose transporter Tret1-like n=1 Tax=Melanaphis sacchari TaxID=742174 RepID=UPI000DC149E0|nr:facilitated trehalose transporter Tret1-like [Melanaphis sacchari]
MSNVKEIQEQKSAQNYGPKATLAQCLATIAQSFLYIGLGMNVSMPAIVIRDLYQNPNSEFSITTTEASWYASLLFIFHPVGCLLSGILQDKFGKKRCMIFSNVPSFIGWVLLYSAQSSISLCASALLMGFSTGLGAESTSSYVGEITEPRLRGSLGSLGSAAMRIGSLLMYILGLFFDWRTSALISTFCPITCICFVIFIPESPIWLIAKGRNEKAEEAICWLRGWVEPEKIKPEFLELVHYNEVSGTRSGCNTDTDDKKFFSNLTQFKNPAVYRPLRLMMIFFFVSFIVSMFPTRPFITKVMKEIDLFDHQNESLILLTGLTSIGCIITTATVHRVGKRLLTLLTLTLNTVLLFSLGAYIIAVKTEYLIPSPLISLTILCGIYFFGSCGISCIPWMTLIEVFPNKSRGVATSASLGLAYIILFTLTKSYLIIEMYLSLEYTMILFGCIGLFGLIYLYFYLPETENKTLLEIEEFFASNSKA